MRLVALLASGTLVLAACGGSPEAAPGAQRVVLVSAPVSSAQWVGTFVERGARQRGAAQEEVVVGVADPQSAGFDVAEDGADRTAGGQGVPVACGRHGVTASGSSRSCRTAAATRSPASAFGTPT